MTETAPSGFANDAHRLEWPVKRGHSNGALRMQKDPAGCSESRRVMPGVNELARWPEAPLRRPLGRVERSHWSVCAGIPAGSTVDCSPTMTRLCRLQARACARVHASSDAVRSMSTRSDGYKCCSTVSTSRRSPTAECDPVTRALELRPEGDSNVMLTVPNVRLDAGKTCTIVIVGRVRTAPKFETSDAMAAPACSGRQSG